MIQGRLKDQNP